jgi:hypothetical protein
MLIYAVLRLTLYYQGNWIPIINISAAVSPVIVSSILSDTLHHVSDTKKYAPLIIFAYVEYAILYFLLRYS